MRSPGQILALVLFGALAAAITAGCTPPKTQGQKNLQKIDKTVSSLIQNLKECKEELNETIAAHQRLVGGRDDRVTKNFGDYRSALRRVDRRRLKINKLVDTWDMTAEAYFTRWEEDLGKLTSRDLERRSRRRMEDARERFTALDDSSEEMQVAFEEVMTTLRDHELFLSNDLSPETVSSLEGDRERIDESSMNLREKLDATLAAAREYLRVSRPVTDS